MKKGPITWIKSKVKQGLDYIDDKTVNMAPLDKETKSIRAQDAKNMAAKTKALQDRTAYETNKNKEIKGYAAEYKTPEWYKTKYKTRQDYYDKVVNKKGELSKAYAEKKYQEAKTARLSSKSPKTKEQSTKTKKKNFVTIDKKEKSNKA